MEPFSPQVEHKGPEYLDRETQSRKNEEQILAVDLRTLLDYYNQSEDHK